jgi:hypothetical protein
MYKLLWKNLRCLSPMRTRIPPFPASRCTAGAGAPLPPFSLRHNCRDTTPSVTGAPPPPGHTSLHSRCSAVAGTRLLILVVPPPAAPFSNVIHLWGLPPRHCRLGVAGGLSLLQGCLSLWWSAVCQPVLLPIQGSLCIPCLPALIFKPPACSSCPAGWSFQASFYL